MHWIDAESKGRLSISILTRLDVDRMQSLYILYLDRHHLSDALFLKSLAQHLADADRGGPACLLVHGSGEKVERTLEAQGYFPERTGGVLQIETDEQRRLVERAVREMNQEIVSVLTDEVVSAVGIQGVDRGLLQRASDGRLRASNAGWIEALVKQHVVPVVSALAEDQQQTVQEVSTAAVVAALAEALEESFDPVACILTTADQPGIAGEDGIRDEVAANELSEDAVPDPAAVRQLAEMGVQTLVTTLQGVFRSGGAEGTRVRASDPSARAQ